MVTGDPLPPTGPARPSSSNGRMPGHQLEPVEIDRLRHERTGAAAVGGHNVGVAVAGREHDDRNGLEQRIDLHFVEHFEPVHAGHVDVEQHQAGARRAGIRTFAAEKRHGLFPVVHRLQQIDRRQVAQRLLQKQHVVLVVVDDENVQRRVLECS